MLRDIGVSSFEELLAPIPEPLRYRKPLNLPLGKSEWEVKTRLTAMARRNLNATAHVCFMGAGSYDHYVPSTVNAVAGRSEFVTAYTPYQPEVSQGTLQVIYEFQTMICELFGMEAANASLYDGGTALAEAVLLAQGHTNHNVVLWSESVHPHYRQTSRTLSHALGLTFRKMPLRSGTIHADDLGKELSGDVAAVVFQYPNFFGIVEDIAPMIKRAHDAGALAIVVADPMAMGVLEAPGKLGADIVVGEGQALGNTMSYGGPYLGLFACKLNLVRRAPGRITGITKDVDGRRGFVLTLQTREQHIRRDKATSNICTNEGLMATRATIYMSLLGPQGFQQIGDACLRRCAYLRAGLSKINGVKLPFGGTHFKEFVLQVPGGVSAFLEFMAKRNILAGVPLHRFGMGLDDGLLVAVTETRTKDEMDNYVAGGQEFVKGGAR